MPMHYTCSSSFDTETETPQQADAVHKFILKLSLKIPIIVLTMTSPEFNGLGQCSQRSFQPAIGDWGAPIHLSCLPGDA